MVLYISGGGGFLASTVSQSSESSSILNHQHHPSWPSSILPSPGKNVGLKNAVLASRQRFDTVRFHLRLGSSATRKHLTILLEKYHRVKNARKMLPVTVTHITCNTHISNTRPPPKKKNIQKQTIAPLKWWLWKTRFPFRRHLSRIYFTFDGGVTPSKKRCKKYQLTFRMLSICNSPFMLAIEVFQIKPWPHDHDVWTRPKWPKPQPMTGWAAK